MSPKTDTKKSTAASKANKGLSAEEIAAMKETLKERKAAASKEEAGKSRACGDCRDERTRSFHGETNP